MTQQTLVLDDHTLPVLAPIEGIAAMQSNVLGSDLAPTVPADSLPSTTEPLLREALGATLREFRSNSGFTLRQLAALASVSPGYLSELERGTKEVSSELLASVCHAMGVSVSQVIVEAAEMMALDAAAAELAANMA